MIFIRSPEESWYKSEFLVVPRTAKQKGTQPRFKSKCFGSNLKNSAHTLRFPVQLPGFYFLAFKNVDFVLFHTFIMVGVIAV